MISERDLLETLEVHKGILIKICRAYASSPIDQKDLEQEMVYQLWKSRKSFRGRSKPSTWIYRVALNTAMVHLRKEKSRLQVQIEDIPDSWSNSAKTSDALDKVYIALQNLKRTEKAIMLLFLDGYNLKESAELLGLSHSNARVLMHRSKQKLKKLLNPLEK